MSNHNNYTEYFDVLKTTDLKHTNNNNNNNENNHYEYINHPSHYNSNGIEVIDIIDAYNLDFYKGNIIKYLLRAGKKPAQEELQDLNKCKWYLERLIKNISNNNSNN